MLFRSKVSIAAVRGTISVYPNPVKGNDITLRFKNMAAGKYALNLYNPLGQQVYAGNISHAGGSAGNNLHIYNLPQGIYQLKITGSNGAVTILQLIKD